MMYFSILSLLIGCGDTPSPKTDDTGTSPTSTVTSTTTGTQSSSTPTSTSSTTSSTTSTTSSTTSTTSPTTTDTGPCDPFPAVPGETVSLTLVHEGIPRDFELHLPADYDCTPRPVVIGVHGYYGSGSGFQNSTAHMGEHLEENGYIGLFPDGLQMSDSGYGRWVTSFNDIGSRFDDGPDGSTCTTTPYPYGAYDNCPADEASRDCPWGTSCADDLGFFEAMLDFTGERLTVDEDRVYMTGFSQGGQTTLGLACGLAHRLAAVAPMHGFAANGYTCGPDTALGMIQFSGIRDTIVPEDGVSSGGLIYDHADETAEEWAAAQGCDAELSPYATAYDGVEGMVCMQHAACDTGASVVWCRWDGSHSWPRNSSDGNFGLETVWSFFEAHHR